jgi:hypothetical protein
MMMRRARLTLLTLALAGSATGGALAAAQRANLMTLPHWLPGQVKNTLELEFGGAQPIHTYYISYPRKIAVIFEFDRVVVCGRCESPSNASTPRGKVIRVSFDRQTHRMNGSMQFCESRGTKPSRALCLRR